MRSVACPPESVRRGGRSGCAPFRRGCQLSGALQRPRGDRVATAGARPLRHRREIGGGVLVRARQRRRRGARRAGRPATPRSDTPKAQDERAGGVLPAPTGRSPSARASAEADPAVREISIRSSSSALSTAVAGTSRRSAAASTVARSPRVVDGGQEEQRANLLRRGLDAARIRAFDEARDREPASRRSPRGRRAGSTP